MAFALDVVCLKIATKRLAFPPGISYRGFALIKCVGFGILVSFSIAAKTDGALLFSLEDILLNIHKTDQDLKHTVS